MAKTRVKRLSDRDWDQLLRLASGFLTHTDGDLRAAMALALQAHRSLIIGIKDGIAADVPQGEITMHIPESGGVALKMRRKQPVREEPLAMEEAPREKIIASDPYLTLDVLEVAYSAESNYATEDSGAMDDLWSEF